MGAMSELAIEEKQRMMKDADQDYEQYLMEMQEAQMRSNLSCANCIRKKIGNSGPCAKCTNFSEHKS